MKRREGQAVKDVLQLLFGRLFLLDYPRTKNVERDKT
jgi:hypothetical protein